MANTNKGNLGTLTSTPVIKSGSVQIPDKSNDVSADYYRFNISSPTNINLALTNMGYGNYADLYLYRDSNGNGSFDPTSDQLINSSKNFGAYDDEINTRLNPGTYFVQVYSEQYNYNAKGNITYNLALSATSPSAPNNLLAKEIVVGTLSGTGTKPYPYYAGNEIIVNDLIGNGNTSDTYFFTLGSKTKLDISLTGLKSDADIRLIQDRNKNGIVDPGEVINYPATTGIRGNDNEKISLTQLGDYFLQVNEYQTGSTSYNLTFNYTST